MNRIAYKRVRMRTRIALGLMCLAFHAVAQDRYTAPDASAGDGTIAHPWPLQTALNSAAIAPGDTLWLRGGIYRGVFTSRLNGAPRAPITVRGYPRERAIIEDNRARADAATLNVFGAWTDYRDFEVTNRNPLRDISPEDQPHFRPMGVEVQGPHTRFINLVVHDTGTAFGFWKQAEDSELYGNLIFNNGTKNGEGDRRHGHGIYAQGENGTHRIADNIIFNQFGWGIHVYPNPSNLRHFVIEGNIVFNNGANSGGEVRYNNILVNAYAPFAAEDIVIRDNLTYHPFRQRFTGSFSDATLCLGCADGGPAEDVTVENNYFAGGAPVASLRNWQHATISGNSFIGNKGFLAVQSDTGEDYRINNNTYIGGNDLAENALFADNGAIHNFVSWKSGTGHDADSVYQPGLPHGMKIFVRPNRYERGRANIAVFNWDNAETAEIDASGCLRTGDSYRLVHAEDFYGTPAAQGVYDGALIKLPLKPVAPIAAVGLTAVDSTAPEFSAFVLLARSP